VKIYHVADSMGQPLAGYLSGHQVGLGDELVPIAEVDDPEGRYVNCPQCVEELAARRGGSTRRPSPPPFSDLVDEANQIFDGTVGE
jgi:hypothetical protein